MKFSMREKLTNHFKIIESKTEGEAFDTACKIFGVNGFYDLKRYYENENSKDHVLFFFNRAIKNTVKSIHKKNRHGF